MIKKKLLTTLTMIALGTMTATAASATTELRMSWWGEALDIKRR
ncbi:hypothetical protein P4S72_29615 [Vibrio sp. PP-XX7]